MRLGLFGGKTADKTVDKAASAREAARIKAELRAILGLSDTAAIAVNEIICADPACPGAETVILVMIPGQKTKALKLACEMAALTAPALRDAVLREGWPAS